MESTPTTMTQAPEAPPILLFGDAETPKPDDAREILRADMDELVEGRLLVEADPGGGKTHATWSLCEQTAGVLPHLIIDPEGEYAPLRRDHDYVLASATPDEGDVQAHPATAAALTRFLVEHNLSAIFDVFDLDEEDRELFVDNVGRELLRLPRSLWAPRMLLIDEAEQFAPEQGSAICKKRMRSLTKRGRKRGIFTVFCIQRLADFDKGVAAGLLNKLVGPTTFETNLNRAAKDLGLDQAGRDALQNLPSKRFLARGPAFATRGLITVDAAPVTTRPPRVRAAGGARLAPPPPPPDSLKDLLSALQDLTPEPDELTDDPEELRAEIRALRKKLVSPAAPKTAREDIEREVSRRVRSRLPAEVELAARPLREEIARVRGVLAKARDDAGALAELLTYAHAAPPSHSASRRIAAFATPAPEDAEARTDPAASNGASGNGTSENEGSPGGAVAHDERSAVSRPTEKATGKKPRVRADLLAVLLRAAGVPGGLDRRNLAVLAGRSPFSSTHDDDVSTLHREGLVTYPSGNRVAITEEGILAARASGEGPDGPAPISLTELHQAWVSYLARKHPPSLVRTLRALIEERGTDDGGEPASEPLSREELARLTDQSPTSSTFDDNVALLKKLELVAYPRPSRVRADGLLFPNGIS